MKDFRIFLFAVAVFVGMLTASAAGNSWMVGVDGMAYSGNGSGLPSTHIEDVHETWGLQLTVSYKMNFNRFFARPYVGAGYLHACDYNKFRGGWLGPFPGKQDLFGNYGTIVIGGDAGARVIAGLDIHTGPALTIVPKEKPTHFGWRFGLGYTIWKFYIEGAYELRVNSPDTRHMSFPNWVFGVHYIF